MEGFARRPLWTARLAPPAAVSAGSIGVSSMFIPFRDRERHQGLQPQVSFKSSSMSSSDSDLTIGEAARRAGVPTSTLRYWESVGLLAAPSRVGGKRRYDAAALRQISLVLLIKRAGFTLAETRIVLSGLSERTPPPEIWRRLAERKLPEIKQKLAEASTMKRVLEQGLRCDCLTIEDCLSQSATLCSGERSPPHPRASPPPERDRERRRGRQHADDVRDDDRDVPEREPVQQPQRAAADQHGEEGEADIGGALATMGVQRL
jgi:MerR family redox-sensitive transcriptional activator SoxR